MRRGLTPTQCKRSKRNRVSPSLSTFHAKEGVCGDNECLARVPVTVPTPIFTQRGFYTRGDDEARALLREAFTLPADLQIIGDTLHVRLDPASAPRRSRALAALCTELTDIATRYPGTDLT